MSMPSNSDERVSVSCDDCYFRQELLCALKTKVPCPTFRSTAGRVRRIAGVAAKPTRQVRIPMPMRPTADATPIEVSAIPAAMAPHDAAVGSGHQQPFNEVSREAIFTLRDAHVDTESAAVPSVERPCMPPPRDVVFARAAAAERSDRSSTLVVAIDEQPAEQLSAFDAGPAVRSDGSHRSSRIAQRIAMRYPGIAPA